MRKDTMSKLQKPRTRPLGSVRVSSSMDAVPKFPPLQTPRMEGVHGNAMSVPPARTPTEALRIEDRPRVKRGSGSSRSDTNSLNTDDSAAVEKAKNDLKDAMIRERELKQQVLQLRKEIDELRQQIWDKEKLITDLQEQYMRQEEKYKELYEKEQHNHGETKRELAQSQAQLAEKGRQITRLQADCDKQLKDCRQQCDASISKLKEEKAREISIRDEKLNKLKKQMADALQGNSWERQQQLDELSKELNKVQEEADLLRMRLKASKNKQGPCNNCDALATQLTQAQKTIKDKEKLIMDMKPKRHSGIDKLDPIHKQSNKGKLK